MIADPLQRGVGQHQVVVGIRRPARQVTSDEADIGTAVRVGGGEHRRGVVQPDQLTDRQLLGGEHAQLPGAASEIDRPLQLRRGHEREKFVERQRALVAETLVHGGVPRVAHDLYSTCIQLSGKTANCVVYAPPDSSTDVEAS